jgi:hypothetical protein
MERIYVCGGSYLVIDGDSFVFGFLSDLPADTVEKRIEQLKGIAHDQSLVLDRDAVDTAAFRVAD